MIRSIRTLLFLLLSIPAFIMMLASCNTTPFGGIAIPKTTTVMPKMVEDEEAKMEELRALQVVDSSPYIIHPGDTFSFSVYNQTGLSAEILIAPDGTCSLPLIGVAKFGGLSLQEAINQSQEGLKKYIRDPIVSLIPKNVSGYYFTIAGRVSKPGNYPVSIGQTRLLDAIAMAGGFQSGQFHGDTIEMADLDNAYISRAGKRLPVNFKKVVYDGNQLNNIPIRNGDYIYVPSIMNGSVIFLGEVGSNTYVGYNEGMTLLQALPYAGGLRTETYSAYIKVIRGGQENTVVYTVNIDQILKGKMLDFKLCANDIIYIPPDDISKWNMIIRKLLPTLQFINMLAGPFGTAIGYFDFQ